MGLPNMADLSVVMDPSSRASGLDERFVDAVLDVWRQRRAARHARRSFAATARKPKPQRDVFLPLAALAVQGAAPSSWTGDIARPGR